MTNEALANRLEANAQWVASSPMLMFPRAMAEDLAEAARVIRAYDNQSKAIADIAPWLSASLESMTPCQEYRDACEQVFSVDVHHRP